MTPNIFAFMPVVMAMDNRLTKTHYRVLIVLYSFRRKNTEFSWPSRAMLAARCQLPISKISTATTELVALGWLEKTGNGGRSKSCQYRLTVPDFTTDLEKRPAPKGVTITESGTVSCSVTKTVTEPGTHKEHAIEQAKNLKQHQRSNKACLENMEQAEQKRGSGIFVVDAHELIFPTKAQAAEKVALSELLVHCPASYHQKVLDEIEGASRQNVIRNGLIPFARWLVLAVTRGEFTEHRGISVRIGRGAARTRTNREQIAQNQLWQQIKRSPPEHAIANLPSDLRTSLVLLNQHRQERLQSGGRC